MATKPRAVSMKVAALLEPVRKSLDDLDHASGARPVPVKVDATIAKRLQAFQDSQRALQDAYMH
ncbi:MAG TPA: hypothetical protein VIP05_00005, partial [Burkholderiaceae bacterium]